MEVLQNDQRYKKVLGNKLNEYINLYYKLKLRGFVVFIFFWTVFVYDFVAYWTWGLHGWLKELGTIDFAGGTPVHVVSGFTALA